MGWLSELIKFIKQMQPKIKIGYNSNSFRLNSIAPGATTYKIFYNFKIINRDEDIPINIILILEGIRDICPIKLKSALPAEKLKPILIKNDQLFNPPFNKLVFPVRARLYVENLEGKTLAFLDFDVTPKGISVLHLSKNAICCDLKHFGN